MHLLCFLNDVDFPVLVANLNDSIDNPLSKVRSIVKSVVLEVRGFRIGIVGYLTPETNTLVGTTDAQLLPEIDSIKWVKLEFFRGSKKKCFVKFG